MDNEVLTSLIATGIPALVTVFNVVYTNHKTKQKKRTEEEEAESQRRDDMRQEIAETCKQLRIDVDSLRNEVKEDRIVERRARILRFGEECLHNIRHTQEHFKQILKDIKDYEEYCKLHEDFENGVTEATTKQIKEIYSKCLEEHDFL